MVRLMPTQAHIVSPKGSLEGQLERRRGATCPEDSSRLPCRSDDLGRVHKRLVLDTVSCVRERALFPWLLLRIGRVLSP